MTSESKDGESGHERAPACAGCFKWDLFKKSCWYYWDLKKICSQFEAGPNQAPPEGPQQPLPPGSLPPKGEISDM